MARLVGGEMMIGSVATFTNEELEKLGMIVRHPAAAALSEAAELRRENVELHRECVALSERAIADHDKYGRNLVIVCLAGLGIGYPVGFLLCAWLGLESGALGLGCYGLLAVQLGLSWHWRRRDA